MTDLPLLAIMTGVLLSLVAGLLLVYRAGLRRVPDRNVGIVYRRHGRHHPNDVFRIRLHGSVGPQATVLRPNTQQWLMPIVFDVKYVPQVHVPDGTIGLVEARDGRIRPPGRRLSQYYECDNFQDGEAFLRKGGEQGRQLGYLTGGAYYTINTELFTVITTESLRRKPYDRLTEADLHEIPIPEGNVGVVIALDGKEPDPDPDVVGHVVEGHYSYRLPWVFLGRGGQLGVQEEALAGGSSYTINPWFARVVQVPIRDLHLEWTKKMPTDVGNFDSALDEIVVDIHGHRLRLELSQVLRIPAKAAPRLVRRFGEGDLDLIRSTPGAPAVFKPAPIQRFVERELGAAVAGYFTEVVAAYSIHQFIREYDKVRMKLEDRVRNSLTEWNVVTGRTVLGEFRSEDGVLNSLRQKLAEQELELIQEERQRAILQQQHLNKELEFEIERIAIELKGESAVVVLRKQIEVLGQDVWLMTQITKDMARMSVPDHVSIGADALTGRILELMPFSNAQHMLKDLVRQRKAGALQQDPQDPGNDSRKGIGEVEASETLYGGQPEADPA